MTTIQRRDLSRNNFLQHRNPFPQRAELTPPASSIGAASCLCAGADTDWSAVIDGCRDVLAIAVGENTNMDTFERACREANRKAEARPRDPRLERLRRLLDDDISLERAWHEPNQMSGAPAATVEALAYSLRRGVGELTKPSTLRRLSELAESQIKSVCRRVQNFRPEIATPWSVDEVAALIAKWRELHG